jgi:hypothetical protein
LLTKAFWDKGILAHVAFLVKANATENTKNFLKIFLVIFAGNVVIFARWG